MSTYVNRIVQVKVDNKWKTIKLYTGDPDNLKNINDYCDNLCSLRYELYQRFQYQPWDEFCPEQPPESFNLCWATLAQLDDWAAELNNAFFKEMENAYKDNKLEEILSILKKEEFSSNDEYLNRVDEIKEEYYWDFLTINQMVSTAYVLAKFYNIYDIENIRILFYYD